MRRREAERLALEQMASDDIRDDATARVDVPLAELAEAGAEQANRSISAGNVRVPGVSRRSLGRDPGRGLER
jgi:hypothetical protein